MSARQDSSAQGRGSTDAGRPAGPAPHHPVADAAAWADGSDDGAAAWDEPTLGDASAWDGGADDATAAWGTAETSETDAGTGWDVGTASADADADADGSGWGRRGGGADEAPAAAGARASVWDVGAPAPASSWDDEVPRARTAARRSPVGSGADGESGHEADGRADRPDSAYPDSAHPDEALPEDALPEDAPRTRRPRAARTAAATPPTDGDGPTDEVAAVAARLAELVGRSGTGGRSAAAGRAAVEHTAGDEDATAAPDAVPSARRDRGGTARRSGGARRPPGGRRRAPASEPPEDGPAAQDAEPDHESVARSVALRLLTGAPKSRHQLAEAMAKRDVPEEVADRVLDRFTEVGLVDDAAYAEILVRSRHTERGLSRRALAQELRRRGVDDETAQEALEQVDDADEEQAARALARKKLRATRGLDRETRLRRAYGALGRRGYGGSLVSRVVREELDAEGAGEDDADDGTGFGRG
jgi:regulatory protein